METHADTMKALNRFTQESNPSQMHVREAVSWFIFSGVILPVVRFTTGGKKSILWLHLNIVSCEIFFCLHHTDHKRFSCVV